MISRLAVVAVVWVGAALAGCAVPERVRTLEAGVLRVAVTTASPTSEYDSQLWIRRYVEGFAAEEGLRPEWVVVPFTESWRLAGQGEVDLVATNVASFPDRVSPGGTFSAPFLYERRALRIRPGMSGDTTPSPTSSAGGSGWSRGWRPSATCAGGRRRACRW